MPLNLVKAAAKKHNISVDKAEKTWKKAKAAAADQGHKEDYAYINGVFQKMLGESIIPMELIMARHEMQSDAWYLGYDAGQHKNNKDNNPYNQGSLSYKQWEQGFEVGTPDPELDEAIVVESSEQLFKVTYDVYGNNKEKPLYTKTQTVRANSEQEAINVLRKLVGGTNYRIELDEGVNKVNLKELVKDQNDYAEEIWGQPVMDLYSGTDEDTITHIEGLLDALKAGEILSYSEDDLKWMEDPDGGYAVVSNGEYSESNLATIAVDLLGIYNDVGTVSVENNELDEAHVAELGVDVDPDKWYVVSGANTMHGGVENAFDSEAAAMNWATTQPNIDLADDDAVILGKDLIEVYAINEDTDMSADLDNISTDGGMEATGETGGDGAPIEENISVDGFEAWRSEILQQYPEAVFYGNEVNGFVAKVDDKVISVLGESQLVKENIPTEYLVNGAYYIIDTETREYVDGPFNSKEDAEMELNGATVDNADVFTVTQYTEAAKTSLPTKFDSGEEFAEYVYNEFKHPETYVEYQGDGAWFAEIGGNDNIKTAVYSEKNQQVDWLDAEDKLVEAVEDEIAPEMSTLPAPIGNFVVDKVLDMDKGVALVQFVENTSDQGDYAVVIIGDDMLSSGLPLPSLANTVSFHGSFNDALESYQNKLAEVDKMGGTPITAMLPVMDFQDDDFVVTMSESTEIIVEPGAYIRYNDILTKNVESGTVKSVEKDESGYRLTLDQYTGKQKVIYLDAATGWRNPSDTDYTWRKPNGQTSHYVPVNDSVQENKFAIIDLAKQYFGDIEMQPIVANGRKYISIKPKSDVKAQALNDFEADLKKLDKSVTYNRNTKEIQVESFQLSPFERAGLKVIYSEDGKKAFIKIFTEQEMVKFNKTLENFAVPEAIGEVKYKVSDSEDNALYEIEVEMLQYSSPNPNPEQAMKEMPVSK